MLIGITGRGGSGKSTVAQLIQHSNPNYTYIKVDDLVEKYVFTSSRLLNNVNNQFTDKEYTIKDIVMAYFSDDEKDKKIHELFVEEVETVLQEKIASIGSKNFIIDWFLLHEMSSFKKMDIKILMTLDRDLRIDRVKKRNQGKDINTFIEVDNFYRENYDCEFDYIFDTSNNDYIEDIKALYKRMNVR